MKVDGDVILLETFTEVHDVFYAPVEYEKGVVQGYTHHFSIAIQLSIMLMTIRCGMLS